jgi:predicted negative regulator of RcsB-dependent stress response
MKKPSVVLATILWIGLIQVGISQPGGAQPTQASYSQTLAQSKESLRTKHYEVAEREAQALLAAADSTEETGTGLIILGETFYRRKMYDQAHMQWNKVLSLAGTEDSDLRIFAHLNLARAYTAQSYFDKAAPEYKAVVDSLTTEDKTRKDKARKDESTNAIFKLALANAYYHTQQFDLAQKQLSSVVESSRDNSAFLSVALARAGQVDLVQRKYKDSLAKFQQILDIKEVTPGIQTYAQGQILPLKGFIASHLGAGEINSEIKVKITAPKEFDNKIDVFLQTFIDDFVVEYAVLETL